MAQLMRGNTFCTGLLKEKKTDTTVERFNSTVEHSYIVRLVKVMPAWAWLLIIREQSEAMDEEVLAIQKRYRETSLKMPWGLGHRRRSIAKQTKRTTATGEDEVEQSLRLALLAGKVEALGQSSQSKCESWRLKVHFPSSSPVWRGAI